VAGAGRYEQLLGARWRGLKPPPPPVWPAGSSALARVVFSADGRRRVDAAGYAPVGVLVYL
jgi:hypothetical protein